MGLFGFLLLAIQTSSFIWVLIWAKVSERIGKKNIYYLGAGFFVLALLGLFFPPARTGRRHLCAGRHGWHWHLGRLPGALEHDSRRGGAG